MVLADSHGVATVLLGMQLGENETFDYETFTLSGVTFNHFV